MADDRSQFAARLFNTFLKEASGHVAAIEVLLTRLEQEPHRQELLAELTREVHSLKGAAGAVEQSEVEFLSRSLEQVLIQMQRNGKAPEGMFFDVFRQAKAVFDAGLPALGQGGKFVIPLQFLESARKLT